MSRDSDSAAHYRPKCRLHGGRSSRRRLLRLTLIALGAVKGFPDELPGGEDLELAGERLVAESLLLPRLTVPPGVREQIDHGRRDRLPGTHLIWQKCGHRVRLETPPAPG
jgi:hypothetical protein